MDITELEDLANCTSCGKPTLGPIFHCIATDIGVSEERLLAVLKKQKVEGFLGFACKDCTTREMTRQYLRSNYGS